MGGQCGSQSMPAIWRFASTACVAFGVAASSGPGYALPLWMWPEAFVEGTSFVSVWPSACCWYNHYVDVLASAFEPLLASRWVPMSPAREWLSLALVPRQGCSCACLQRWSFALKLARGAPWWCAGDQHTHYLQGSLLGGKRPSSTPCPGSTWRGCLSRLAACATLTTHLPQDGRPGQYPRGAFRTP